jgi:hypothetical protein
MYDVFLWLWRFAALGGYAASAPEVRTRLGEEYIGKNVDNLVIQWGPPTSTFKMNSGQSSYVWQLSSVTDIQMNHGSGSASTDGCKVSVIASPTGIVTQLDTQDYNPGGSGLIGRRSRHPHLRGHDDALAFI